MKRIVSAFLLCILLLAGCANNNPPSNVTSDIPIPPTTSPSESSQPDTTEPPVQPTAFAHNSEVLTGELHNVIRIKDELIQTSEGFYNIFVLQHKMNYLTIADGFEILSANVVMKKEDDAIRFKQVHPASHEGFYPDDFSERVLPITGEPLFGAGAGHFDVISHVKDTYIVTQITDEEEITSGTVRFYDGDMLYDSFTGFSIYGSRSIWGPSMIVFETPEKLFCIDTNKSITGSIQRNECTILDNTPEIRKKLFRGENVELDFLNGPVYPEDYSILNDHIQFVNCEGRISDDKHSIFVQYGEEIEYHLPEGYTTDNVVRVKYFHDKGYRHIYYLIFMDDKTVYTNVQDITMSVPSEVDMAPFEHLSVLQETFVKDILYIFENLYILDDNNDLYLVNYKY